MNRREFAKIAAGAIVGVTAMRNAKAAVVPRRKSEAEWEAERLAFNAMLRADPPGDGLLEIPNLPPGYRAVWLGDTDMDFSINTLTITRPVAGLVHRVRYWIE